MLCLAVRSECGSPLAIPTPGEEEFTHQVLTGHLRTHKWTIEVTSRKDPDQGKSLWKSYLEAEGKGEGETLGTGFKFCSTPY